MEVTSPCSIWEMRAMLTPSAAAMSFCARPSCLRVLGELVPPVLGESLRAPAWISSAETPAAVEFLFQGFPVLRGPLRHGHSSSSAV